MKLIKYSVFAFVLALFTSCGLKERASEAIAEKAMGAMLGTEVESSNLSKAAEATAEIDLTFAGQPVAFENPTPIINVAGGDKVTFALNIVQEEEGKQQSLQISVLGKKELFKLPMTATIGSNIPDDQAQGMVNMAAFTNDGMQMNIATKGTLTIKSYSEDQVVIEIDAEGGENNVETHEGKNLKPIKGKVICKSPVATYLGIKKEELF